MARHKNSNYSLPDHCENWQQVSVAVLMDIRDELQTINRVLACDNLRAIPFKLDLIILNTARRKYRKRTK